MNLSIRKWYNLLPEPYRTNAIQAAEDQGLDVDDCDSLSLSSAINCFIWVHTTEVQGYWAEIDRKVRMGTLGEVPQPGFRYICVNTAGSKGGGWKEGRVVTVASYDQEDEIVWPDNGSSGIYIYTLERMAEEAVTPPNYREFKDCIIKITNESMAKKFTKLEQDIPGIAMGPNLRRAIERGNWTEWTTYKGRMSGGNLELVGIGKHAPTVSATTFLEQVRNKYNEHTGLVSPCELRDTIAITQNEEHHGKAIINEVPQPNLSDGSGTLGSGSRITGPTKQISLGGGHSYHEARSIKCES